MKKSLLFLVVLVATLASTPAWARCLGLRPCRHDRGPSSVEAATERTTGLVDEIFGNGAERMCQRHTDPVTGQPADKGGLSWCCGIITNSQNRFVRYNTLAAHPTSQICLELREQYEHPEPELPPTRDTWGEDAPWRRREPQPKEPEQDTVTLVTVRNTTEEKVEINGHCYKPGESTLEKIDRDTVHLGRVLGSKCKKFHGDPDEDVPDLINVVCETTEQGR